ncbi:MAG: trypsin-like peptidase domain-containing protein [Coriobacteriia bacterium]|nr:trypsin-like peptidase domain-containing protein [Coriobacteriia bacterium]MCL2536918.1 trypsin-like peptidase domain-containing protein [Coriobacteriia bacterium]
MKDYSQPPQRPAEQPTHPDLHTAVPPQAPPLTQAEAPLHPATATTTAASQPAPATPGATATPAVVDPQAAFYQQQPAQQPLLQPAQQPAQQPMQQPMSQAPQMPAAQTPLQQTQQQAHLTQAYDPNTGVQQNLPHGAPTAADFAYAASPAATAPDQKRKKRSGRIALIVLGLLLFFGGAGALLSTQIGLWDRSQTATITLPGVTGDDSAESSPTATIAIPEDVTNPSENELSVQVARKVLPSVVSVSGSMDMGMGGMSPAQSAGAGVIISPEGYIVTNNHVIESLTNITVNAGGQPFDAVLIGADPSTDLAVLKIDAPADLPAITIGSSSNLLEGQYVMAIGSPFGHEQSVSAGIISGLGRNNVVATQTTLTAYVDLIQTDAAINPGNSGGALVDKEGRLIGINSLINSLSGASNGVGFAIPVDTVVHVTNQLIETGHASHAFLGIGSQTITPEVAQAFGLPIDRGVVINSVVGGSPADVAGLQVGDYILRIGNHQVASSEDVFSAIRSHRVGDRVEVEVYRSGENRVLEAVLASDDFMNRLQEQQPPQQQLPPQHPPTNP